MSAKSKRPRRRRLSFEMLEDRQLLATFTVNSTADNPDSYPNDGICDTLNYPDTVPPIPPSGICTLRAALQQANASPGSDTVEFALPAGSVITSDTNGTITETITINGPPGRIELRAVGNGASRGGFVIGAGGGGSTIRNMVITGFRDGSSSIPTTTQSSATTSELPRTV